MTTKRNVHFAMRRNIHSHSTHPHPGKRENGRDATRGPTQAGQGCLLNVDPFRVQPAEKCPNPRSWVRLQPDGWSVSAFVCEP
jgi:hypothetical protein